MTSDTLESILRDHQPAVLSEWTDLLLKDSAKRGEAGADGILRSHAQEFLSAFSSAAQSGRYEDVNAPAWSETREVLTHVSGLRARQGATPSENAGFIFSLKRPLFGRLQQILAEKPAEMLREIEKTNDILDKLGLFTMEVFQKTREEVIQRQQEDMLELSTPVVKLWDGVLALPVIGTLDSGRTQVVMENLLQQIVHHGASIAIIDITGVPTVDTLVAQHLLKTVAAARLMGADCIISGIRPQIAATIVHLGVDLQDVLTKATLADAFSTALKRLGLRVTKNAAAAMKSEE